MQAEHFEATNEEYHASPGVSHSMLEKFIEDPQWYQGLFVTKDIARQETTPLSFGSLVEAYLLEPENVVEIPAEVLSKSGSKAGNAWKDFDAENAGKQLVKQDQMSILRRIQMNVNEHRMARKALLEGDREIQQSYRWTDEKTGLLLRCRLDVGKPKVIVDLKTAASIKPLDFVRASLRFGYHRQAQMYREGVAALTGETLPFVFVVVKNTAPWSVRTFDFHTEEEVWLHSAQLENDYYLGLLAKCYESGVWCEPNHGDLNSLWYPTWAKNNDQWSV